MINCKCNYIKN